MSEREQNPAEKGMCPHGNQPATCPKCNATEIFWREKSESREDVAKGLAELKRFGEGLDNKKKENAQPNLLDFFTGDQKTAETHTYPWNPNRPVYGAMPFFEKYQDVVADFPNQAEYFLKHYKLGEGPAWRDPYRAEGAMLYELKFDKKLSDLCESILSNYPDLGGEKGKDISLFGLSGSGKSSSIEAIREALGDRVVVMDSDTVRYNLLAKDILDTESQAGADLEKIRSDLINNNISGALYFAIEHVANELKDRGYDVITAGTVPIASADIKVYVEHPDGIDPTKIDDDQIESTARDLYKRTSERVGDHDDYDWQNAETITKFEDMKPVTVQVPERVHQSFVRNVRDALISNKDIKHLVNPRIDDPNQREENMLKQIQEVLGDLAN